MSKLKIVFYYLLFALVCSCVTKKKVQEKSEIIKSDTLINKVKIIEVPPILTSLNITEICDTITGKPKTFRQKINVGKDTVIVEIKDNELLLNYQKAKGTLSKLDSIVRVRNSETKELKATEKNTIPFKHWVYLVVSIASNLVLIYFLVRSKLPF